MTSLPVAPTADCKNIPSHPVRLWRGRDSQRTGRWHRSFSEAGYYEVLYGYGLWIVQVKALLCPPKSCNDDSCHDKQSDPNHDEQIAPSILTRTFGTPQNGKVMIAVVERTNGLISRSYCFGIFDFQSFMSVVEKTCNFAFVFRRIVLCFKLLI